MHRSPQSEAHVGCVVSDVPVQVNGRCVRPDVLCVSVASMDAASHWMRHAGVTVHVICHFVLCVASPLRLCKKEEGKPHAIGCVKMLRLRQVSLLNVVAFSAVSSLATLRPLTGRSARRRTTPAV